MLGETHDLAQTTALAREALHATCAELAIEPVQAAPVDRSRLAQILAEPQFAGRRGQAWALERMASRVLDLLKDLLQQSGFRSFSLVGRDVFLGLVVVLLALGLWRVLTQQGTRTRAEANPQERAPAQRLPGESELAEAAERALENGELREALRQAMQAVVSALGRRGLVDARGTATNRELAIALAPLAEDRVADLLSSLAHQFDGAVYGEGPIDSDLVRRFLLDATALRAALPEAR